MNSFFSMFSIVSIFTVLAKFNVIRFETLQTENLAKDNFEFFLYAYLFLTGALAASSYEYRSWFRSSINKFTGHMKSTYLGFSGSLVGWCFGLLVFVIIKGQFSSIALGLFLTSYMLLIAIAPAWYHEQIEFEKEKMVGYIFREPRFAKLFKSLGWVFMLASLVGFYDYFNS